MLWEIQSRYGALTVPCGQAIYSIKCGGQGEPLWEGKMTPELKGQRELATRRKKLLCKGHKAGTCLGKGRIARR